MRRKNLFYGAESFGSNSVDECFVAGNYQDLYCDNCGARFYFHPDVMSLICPDCDEAGSLLFEGEDYVRVVLLGEEE